MLPDLAFDAPTHTYRFAGQVVPSVTQLLDKLHSFAGVPHDVLEAAKERGTAVHVACELDDKGDLDEESVHPLVDGYLAGWRRFKAEMKPQILAIEDRGFNRLFRYAGTRDRRLLINGQPWTIDIKTSAAAHPCWGLQLAAYTRLFDGCFEDRRGTVQLRPDGTYSLLSWTDPADWPTFAGIVQLTHWSTKHAR